MAKKRRHRRIRAWKWSMSWCEVIGIKLTHAVIPHIPFKIINLLSHILGSLGYLVSFRTRKRIMNNLHKAFQDTLEQKKKKSIARITFVNIIKGYFETMLSCNSFKHKVLNQISVTGEEHLKTALEGGKGIIAVTAHFGNFILMGTKLHEEGYPFYTVIREPRDPRIARVLRRYRSMMGFPSIPAQPRKLCIRSIFAHLRSNKIVCLIVDENKKRGGITVDFLGHPAPTVKSPAFIALKTGAAIIPIFIVRQKKDFHNIIINPPLHYTITGDKTQDIYTITLHITKIIESYITHYPTQWYWINDRWKTSKHSHSTSRENHQRKPLSI